MNAPRPSPTSLRTDRTRSSSAPRSSGIAATTHTTDCEAVAEAAAHVVSARFGLDLTAHSAGYIAGWICGDIDRFIALQQRVGQVSRTVLPPDRLDLVLDAAANRLAEQARTPRTAAVSR